MLDLCARDASQLRHFVLSWCDTHFVENKLFLLCADEVGNVVCGRRKCVDFSGVEIRREHNARLGWIHRDAP